MKVLQLCNKPPFPTVDGGTIAMHALTQGLLNAGHTVKVVSIETSKHPFKKDKLSDSYKEQTQAEAVFLDTEIKLPALMGSFITGGLYILKRFKSEKLKGRLIQILQTEKFDVVLLESIYVAPYIETIRQYSSAKIVLRAHNVEHLIWQRMADNATNILRTFYLQVMVGQLRKYEKAVFAKVNGVAAISNVDAQTIRELTPRAKVETINLSTEYKPVEGVEIVPDTVFHLGSMDWMPNVEGVLWLIDEVWPLVLENQPHAKLYLAGRNMPKNIFSRTSASIVVEGAIDSPTEYMATKQIMVVPLFAGSGVRVKIIEGMALGKAIVATDTAVEGVDVNNGKNILLANSAQNFANAIIGLLKHPEAVNEIGAKASAFIDSNYRSAVVIKKLESFIAAI